MTQPYPPQQPPQHQPEWQHQAPKRHTLRNIVLGVLIGGLLLLGGCVALVGIGASESGKEAEKSTNSAPTQTTPEVTTPTPVDDSPAAVPETTAPPEEPGVAKVGATQWFTYEDGLKVQVTKLARFKIGQHAAGGSPGDSGVIVTVTIRNGTGKPFNLDLASVKLQSGPNGDEAEAVYDLDKGLGMGFTGTVTNGRAKTAKFGFAVPKTHLGKVAIEVTPSWDHDAAFFEGAAR
jgi:hypothetical protein